MTRKTLRTYEPAIIGPQIKYEPNKHIQQHIKYLRKTKSLSDDEKEYYVKRMLGLEAIIQSGSADPEMFKGDEGYFKLAHIIRSMDYTQEGKYNL